MRRIKMFIFIVSLAACMALCPLLAHAADLAGGSQNANGTSISGEITASGKAAKKKVVYVLSSITASNLTGDYTHTKKFSYTKSGMVKKVKETHKSKGQKARKISTLSYTYDKSSNLVKLKDPYSTTTYMNNKKGQPLQCTTILKQASASKCVSKLKYRGGNAVRKTTTYYFRTSGNKLIKGGGGKSWYSYANGRVTKIKDDSGDVYFIEYDDRGNILRWRDYCDGRLNYFDTYEYENEYDADGNLVKRLDGDSFYTFKYRKIKVKASVAPKVARQQWAFKNRNLNFGTGEHESVV